MESNLGMDPTSAIACDDNNIHTLLQSYLQDKNLNLVFIDMIEAMLLAQPDNAIAFMVKYLMEKFPEETKDIFFPTLPRIVTQGEPSITAESSDVSDLESEKSIDCEISSSTGPTMIDNRTKCGRRRSSVCAEQLSQDQLEEYIQVVPKSEGDMERIKEILERNVFFQHLDEDQMMKVQRAMFCIEKEEGDVIIQQGDDGDNFYIIDSGLVQVCVDTIDEKFLREDDSFGELAIMYSAPRSATCIAKSHVKLWALDRISFKVILMETSITTLRLHKSFLQKIGFLSHLTEMEKLTIADALTAQKFENDEIICNEGDAGDCFYIVEEGTVICTKKDEGGASKELARLTMGSYFGEIALLTSKPRQATIQASGPVKCLTLNRKTFNRVMGPLHDVLMRNMVDYNNFHNSF